MATVLVFSYYFGVLLSDELLELCIIVRILLVIQLFLDLLIVLTVLESLRDVPLESANCLYFSFKLLNFCLCNNKRKTIIHRLKFFYFSEAEFDNTRGVTREM
jgi:hypothetical protein